MNHRTSLAALLLITLATSACATPGQRRAAIISGVAIAAAGTALLVGESSWEPRRYTEEELESCLYLFCNTGSGDHVLRELGDGLLIAAGLAIAVIGATSDVKAPPAPADVRSAPAPLVASRDARPLPAQATDPATLRLAQQARRAAMQLDCTTTEFMLHQVRDRDPAYERALVASAVVAPCR